MLLVFFFHYKTFCWWSEDVILLSKIWSDLKMHHVLGFRYELFCVVKAAKTTQCVLHINCDVTFCLESNSKKELYSEETIRALCQRFETPQSNARWDWPLVQLTPFEPIDVDRVQQLLTNRTALVPNLSTQNPPRLASEALNDLDKITQALTVQVSWWYIPSWLGQTLCTFLVASVLLRILKKLYDVLTEF